MVFGLNSDGVLGVSHSGRTGVDMELKMDHIAYDVLVTLERVSWSRGNIAYARLSATMKRLGLIDVIL